MIYSSQAIGAELLELLGIKSKHVIWANIMLKVDQPVKVELECYATDENGDVIEDSNKLKTLIKRYKLEEVPVHAIPGEGEESW